MLGPMKLLKKSSEQRQNRKGPWGLTCGINPLGLIKLTLLGILIADNCYLLTGSLTFSTIMRTPSGIIYLHGGMHHPR